MLETKKVAQKVARMGLRALVGLTTATMLTGLGIQTASAQAMRPKASIYGVTVDDVSNINATVASLTHLSYKPTVRVVLDLGTTVTQYYPALVEFHAVAYVMGEIMDSHYFPSDLQMYADRTNELVGTLKSVVDVREIANEINGEWLCTDPTGPNSVAASEEQDIGNMVAAAHDIVKTAGGLTAATMYYNDDGKDTNCCELPTDSWCTQAQSYLPARVHQDTDYALFSYYPYQDCPGLGPTRTNDLKLPESILPIAKVGFGGIGASSIPAPASVQQNLFKSCCPMGTTTMAADRRFTGGYFWQNYVEQMLPHSTSLCWSLLNNTVKLLTAPQ